MNARWYSEIAAHPTRYGGRTYRSRLEARARPRVDDIHAAWGDAGARVQWHPEAGR